MSRVYNVPADVREKEKIIGGVLTLGQGVWLMGGFILALGCFAGALVLTKSVPLSLICGVPLIGTGIPFAFFKKNDIPLPTYIVRKYKFNKKTHKLINKRNVD